VDDPVNKTAICVIGMHRSGTSAITKTISCLGVDLGNEGSLMEGAEDNPRGFWENRKIQSINDQILNAMDREWCSVLPANGEWWERQEIQPLKEELKQLILSEYPDQKLWIWKDPRTTILLPLWQDIMSELNVKLKYVICLRNPVDVYQSLHKRNGFTKKRSFDLWSLYTVNALYWTSEAQRVVVRYEDLLDDWESVLRTVSHNLEIDWPQNTDRLKREVEAFLTPELRHHISGTGELLESDHLAEDMKQLYLDLTQGTQLSRSRIESLYHNLAKPCVYIWGAGKGGEYMMERITSLGIEVNGFIDSDPKKSGQIIEGKTVFLPENLLDHPSDVTPVVIGSMYYDDIKQRLHELGYAEERNYFASNGLSAFVRV